MAVEIAVLTVWFIRPTPGQEVGEIVVAAGSTTPSPVRIEAPPRRMKFAAVVVAVGAPCPPEVLHEHAASRSGVVVVCERDFGQDAHWHELS